jgi:hypothetical protein
MEKSDERECCGEKLFWKTKLRRSEVDSSILIALSPSLQNWESARWITTLKVELERQL